MDERRSLAVLGWTVGGIVGLMFTLNAIALSLTHVAAPPARLPVSRAGISVEATMVVGPTAAGKRS